MEKTKKSGSDERVRTKVIGVRVQPYEYEELAFRAAAENMSVPSYLREQVLDEVKTKGRKAEPQLDIVLLSQLLHQCSRIGSNINQIAKRLNEGGGVTASRMVAAYQDVQELKREILQAIKRPTHDNPRCES